MNHNIHPLQSVFPVKWCIINKFNLCFTTLHLAQPAGYSQCRLRPIVALFARSYLVLFNFCFCFAYNFPAHFPSFLQCWPHDFNYLRMEAFLEGGEEKRGGGGERERRRVSCCVRCLWLRPLTKDPSAPGCTRGCTAGLPCLNRGWLCSSSDCWPYSALSPVKRVAEG